MNAASNIKLRTSVDLDRDTLVQIEALRAQRAPMPSRAKIIAELLAEALAARSTKKEN